jgi:hypothetical protein
MRDLPLVPHLVVGSHVTAHSQIGYQGSGQFCAGIESLRINTWDAVNRSGADDMARFSVRDQRPFNMPDSEWSVACVRTCAIS